MSKCSKCGQELPLVGVTYDEMLKRNGVYTQVNRSDGIAMTGRLVSFFGNLYYAASGEGGELTRALMSWGTGDRRFALLTESFSIDVTTAGVEVTFDD